jgi:hypothetical protein
MELPYLHLIIMIDTSASMNNTVQGSRERKLDFAKTKLLDTLKGLRFDSIELFTFDVTHHKVGDFENLQDAIERFPSAAQGTSMIWDSIDSVLDINQERKRSALICVTDGDDTGSKQSCRDVVQKSSTSEIDLKIIDLDGNLKDEMLSSDATKENILEFADIKNLAADLIRLKGHASTEKDSWEISCPVLPLSHVRDAFLKAVVSGVRMAVPYLDKLMQIRYYPVPTLIVDEKIIDNFDLKTSVPPENPQFHDFIEIYGFLAAVCLSLHFEAFDCKSSLGHHPFLNEEFLSCDSEKVGKLWQVAEDVGGLWPYLCWCMSPKDQRGELQLDRICIPEIFVPGDPLTCCEKNLQALLGILKRIQKTHHSKSVRVEERAFKGRKGVYSLLGSEISEGGDRPDLQIWRKYLNAESFDKLRNCIDTKGLWDKDLRKIITAFEIAIPLGIKLARAIATRSIARRIHLCGLYLAGSERNRQAMERVLQALGFPTYFNFLNTGLVMICPERIEKMLQESEDDSLGNKSEQLEKLIHAVVVHEHTHAAALEGVNASADIQYCSRKNGCGIGYEAVSEGLAEWSELDFSRAYEDIHDIIIQHASLGGFPEWPYSGALLIENRFQKEGDYGAYRKLLDLFRSDGKKAFDFLNRIEEI